jgi:hypothetical protein
MVIDVNLLLQIFFWSGAILTVGARFLNVLKKWYCFIFWIIGGAIITIQTVQSGQWNIVSYQLVYMVFNIWGLIDWYQFDKGRKIAGLGKLYRIKEMI